MVRFLTSERSEFDLLEQSLALHRGKCLRKWLISGGFVAAVRGQQHQRQPPRLAREVVEELKRGFVSGMQVLEAKDDGPPLCEGTDQRVDCAKCAHPIYGR